MADVSAENALHEACHATVARLLGIPVISATAAPPKPLVRTRYRITDLEKEAMVDLATLAVDTDPGGTGIDLANAQQHVRQTVRMRHGMALDGGMLPPALEAETTKLLARLRAAAADLVVKNRDAVDRVANALMAGTTLDQKAIDAAILAPEKADQIAARLVEATQDFVEALLEISAARGADAENDFERAVNCIRHMQGTAHNVLRQHGFEPRGQLVE